MGQKANIFDFALITSSVEAGIYFVSFIGIINTLLIPEIYNYGVVLAIIITFLVIILLALLFLVVEIIAILERERFMILAGLIFRGIRILLMTSCMIFVM